MPAARGQVAELLRGLAPQVLGALARRQRDFCAAEDAVQEALLAAALEWAAQGIPDNPGAWLYRVATRRLVDHMRSEQARRRREEASLSVPEVDATPAPAFPFERDDTLALLFMCCHPALSPASAIALTLRAVGGLDIREQRRT